MSQHQIPSRLRATRAAPAPAPAAAGHQPMLLVLALAAAFTALPSQAQPSGAQAIHGAATLTRQGNNLLVTTQNGAGTGHSAINWQSFSIPAGSTTHFAQPGVTSLSINRVVGPNPSAIFGTLSSNGRLVLVNPAGIAVGAGAVVDTAGFTASTLRMSDADAIAGRLRFVGDGTAGALRVDGHVLARSGDVVLIGSDVQVGSQAVVHSPNGATILAAGQKVELTGRGLEGIVFELQAPADQAVNLGTLTGDAVGLFAGTLRHSGLVRASAAGVEGGRVVLKAAGHAETSGTTVAKGADGAGGRVDVLGQTVGVMAGAVIDTSNARGGGQIRVGGDYKGGNPDVPNAQVTFVSRDAQLRANANGRGDGGRIIVWADDTTRAHGSIEAKGGRYGGNGGFVETSGKRVLDVNGVRVNASAAAGRGGKAGTWLLDPNNVTITSLMPTSDVDPDAQSAGSFIPAATADSVIHAADLEIAINNNSNVIVSTAGSGLSAGDITFDATGAPITIQKNAGSPSSVTLELNADGDIRFEGLNQTHFLVNSGHLDVEMNAGSGLVQSNGQVQFSSGPAPGSSVTVKVPAATWTNTGTLTLNLNAKLDLSGTGALVNEGLVNGATGALGGIVGGSFTSGGGLDPANVSVNLTQGMISVDTLAVTSGSFSFDGSTFNAGSFDFNGDHLKLRVNTGGLAIGAGSDIVATGAVELAATGGNVTIDRNVNAERISAAAGIGGTITANGLLETQGFTGVTGSGSVSLNAGGDIDFGTIDTGSSNSRGGDVSLVAGGHVRGSMITSGGGGTGTRGGTVSVTGKADADGIAIDILTIDTTGSGSGVRGGDVQLVGTSGGDVQVGGLDTYGSSNFGGRGGAGGGVHITTQGGGDVVVSSGIQAYGGHSGGGSLGGAGGGMVTITASGGVTVFGGIDATGGSASSGPVTVAAGRGGDVQVRAGSAGIELIDVYASGGSSSGSLGGGMGGMVLLSSSGNIAVNGSLDASGGSSSGGRGGDGHATGVQVVAGQDLAVNSLYVNGGYSSSGPRGGDAAAASLTFGGSLDLVLVQATGGDGGSRSGTGGAGGRGANFTVTRTKGDLDLTGTYIDVGGGWGGGGGTAGGRGGDGGTVNLVARAGGVIVPEYQAVSARGGAGGSSSSSGANKSGRGGDGGTINITAAGASRLLGYLDAGGGSGGEADYYGSNIGGDGGTGGRINVNVTGALRLAGSVGAGGGHGGTAIDYEAGYPYPTDASRAGLAGSMGDVRVAATGGIVVPTPAPTIAPTSPPALQAAAMETKALSTPSPTSPPSSLYVEGNWSNASWLAVAAGAGVSTTGDVNNTGTILLGAGSAFTVGHSYDSARGQYSYGDSTLTNQAGGLVGGSGSVLGNLVNHGTVAPGGQGGVGRLHVSGNFTQSATGRLEMDIAANTPYYPGATYDQLHVGGAAALGGQLFINAVPAVSLSASQLSARQAVQLAASPAATSYYEVINAASSSGQFSLISGPPDLVSQIRMNVGGQVVDVPGGTSTGLIAAIAALLPGLSVADIQQVLTETSNNAIADPSRLGAQEDEEESADGASDIVVTDSACKPS